MKNKGLKKRKRGGKVKMILLIIVLVIAAVMLVGTVLQATYFKSVKEDVEPYGQMVDVFDGEMHIYKMGNGEKTVVLLPGLGTALPSADFGPLMRALCEEYTVVCVEYFGVGFSSQTSRDRTCENYVEEIRTALSKAAITGPYILMPHSISSVYSEYYAAKYPDEVEAIISLDGTSTAYIGEDMPKIVKTLMGAGKFQQAIGFTSIIGRFTADKDKLISYGYSEKELHDIIAFTGFSFNDNLLEQMKNSIEFIKDTNKTTYPESVPYYKIISKDTYETENKQIKMSPEEYQKEHLQRVGAENNYTILEGNHFIYINNAEKIRDVVEEFMGAVKKHH